MMDRPDHSYIGRRKCGCVIAITVDFGDKDTSVQVARFIADGLTVERVTREAARGLLIDIDDCPHREPKPVQQSLFTA